jgi:hypothetical protein
MWSASGAVAAQVVTGQQLKPTEKISGSQGQDSLRGGPALVFLSEGLSTCHISTRAKGGSYFALTGYPVGKVPEDLEDAEVPKRGVIVEFSSKSRRRMMNSLAVIDQARAGLPSFLSLTYPDECLPVTARQVRAHINVFRMALERRYGRKSILWRVEHKARKSGAFLGAVAPHVHFLCWRIEPAEADRRWLADTWTRIIKAKSEAAWKVTFHLKSWFMPDSWRGTLAYVAKYCAKVSDTEGGGRSWGYWRRELLPVELISDEIPQDSFHAVRRVLRAYIAKRCKGRRPPIYYKWQGLSVYLSEAGGEKLVRWAWDIGWSTE